MLETICLLVLLATYLAIAHGADDLDIISEKEYEKMRGKNDYTILWGRDPDELIHENTYTSEQMAWSVYRDLSFTGYAVLMRDGVVIEDNLGRGPVINGDKL